MKHRAWNGCRYAACPRCDACAVCGDFHGNFIAGCSSDDCPYRWYHRVRDFIRRRIVWICETSWL